jgi:hypothetical protein
VTHVYTYASNTWGYCFNLGVVRIAMIFLYIECMSIDTCRKSTMVPMIVLWDRPCWIFFHVSTPSHIVFLLRFYSRVRLHSIRVLAIQFLFPRRSCFFLTLFLFYCELWHCFFFFSARSNERSGLVFSLLLWFIIFSHKH